MLRLGLRLEITREITTAALTTHPPPPQAVAFIINLNSFQTIFSISERSSCKSSLDWQCWTWLNCFAFLRSLLLHFHLARKHFFARLSRVHWMLFFTFSGGKARLRHNSAQFRFMLSRLFIQDVHEKRDINIQSRARNRQEFTNDVKKGVANRKWSKQLSEIFLELWKYKNLINTSRIEVDYKQVRSGIMRGCKRSLHAVNLCNTSELLRMSRWNHWIELKSFKIPTVRPGG